jgi:AraC-like DNA-binding protein
VPQRPRAALAVNEPGAAGQLWLAGGCGDHTLGEVNDGFSTGAVAPTDRVDYWREMVRRHFVPLHVDPLASGEFNGSVRLRSLGELEIARVQAHPMRATRSQRHIERSAGDEYFIGLHIRGVALAEQDGRRATLYPGDFALFDSARPYSIEFRNAGSFDHLIVRMPREMLERRTAQLGQATAVAVRAGSKAGRLVSPCLQALVKLDRDGTFIDPVLDMLALAIMQASGLSAPPVSRQQLASCELKRQALSHLSDPELSPASVARACFISVRQLHRLFALEESTFGGFVREARLERCYRDLADPALAHLKIAQIAQSHGYRSAAVFTRAFTRRYGTAPRAFRRAHAGGLEGTASRSSRARTA